MKSKKYFSKIIGTPVLLIAIAIAVVALGGTTFAYLYAQNPEPAVNQFTYNSDFVDIEIEDEGDSTTKTTVFTNTGNVEGYIRAKLVPAFRGDRIHCETVSFSANTIMIEIDDPQDTVIIIDISGTDWVYKNDGIYEYNSSVDANAQTSELKAEVTVTGDLTWLDYLQLDVLAEIVKELSMW